MQVGRAAAAALAAALAWGAAPAAAQAPGQPQDLFKTRVKPGLYEVHNDVDLTGVPGVPAQSAKTSEVKQRCVGAAEIEQGIQAGKDCRVKDYRATAGDARVTMQCADGTSTDMRFAFSESGFESEMTTTGAQDGKPFRSVFRSKARLLGPCPAR